MKNVILRIKNNKIKFVHSSFKKSSFKIYKIYFVNLKINLILLKLLILLLSFEINTISCSKKFNTKMNIEYRILFII